ncbi:MAG: peptidylprolyl isomerase [Polyangiaceae bacterium]|nr:peptidylprolyl isomerase [Polyangiaceae bacterium]
MAHGLRHFGILGQVVLLGAALVSSSVAHASIVERIVAVVGEKPVLLSELRERARPLMLRVYAQSRSASERAAGLSQVYQHTLDMMIDELLEQHAASDADIKVTKEDVDRMLQVVASQNQLTVEQLLAEAKKSGLEETAYREELKRQTLALRVSEWRFQGRVRATEDDIRSAYEKAVADAEAGRMLRIAWIVVNTGRGSQRVPEKAEKVLKVAQLLQSGADFSDVAKQYSEDEKSAPIGGLLEDTTRSKLPLALQKAVDALQVGQVSNAISVAANTVFVKVVERAPLQLPSYEEARAGLEQQVRSQKINEARKQWLKTLRRRTHVEVRF